MPQDFVHLHNHSEYSLLDGANRVKDLVKLAADHEMPAVALTDHGVMHGAVEFAARCKEAGVKPIIGSEVYTSGNRPRTGRDSKLDKENYHLLLLAQNATGYKNLTKLVSLASIEGFYYKPRVDHELLSQHSEGLIATSTCLGSEVNQALLQGQYETARDIAAMYRDIFTPERYFIELQDHGQAEDKVVNPQLIKIASELGLRRIVTNDIHYGKASDAKPHDVLLCIGTGSKVADEKRMRYPSQEFYFKTRREMEALFPDHGDALNTTVDIAAMVNFDLPLGEMILPHYNVPEGFTYDSYFEHVCWEGAARRYPNITPEQRARIEYEMHVIEVKGYSAYFLIVADFVRWAHARNIPARCRGSAAGSVVSYLLGITNVDPLKYGLLFERFLYMERITPPDIDLDFADYRREEVIQYCRDKYGPDHVAQVITFGTLGARAAIRDVSRALDVPLADADKVAKLIPQHPGKVFTIEGSLKDVPELKRLYDEDPAVHEVLDNARAIEGLSRHSSVHAAAVVITPGPVTDFCPVQKSDTGLVTQYDMGAISSIGLLKMDFLGLRTLTVVEHCLRLIKENHGQNIDIDAVPKDDLKTFQMLQQGHCDGVFQLESSGMKSLVMDIRPTQFEDLIPLVALYRPGPLGNGDTERFIKRRHNLEKVTYIDPCLEPVLHDTYGIFVYQEQIMKVAMQVAGMGSQDADDVLRALSKKKMDKMMAMKPKFIAGAAKTSGLKEKKAEEIFEAMTSFASYGFGLNHSGAYAVLTYQTAWLKANYTNEFMAALLTSISDSKDKVAAYIDDCRRMDPPIIVKAPDVNRSVADFSVDNPGDGYQVSGVSPTPDTRHPSPDTPVVIRFGLFAIKGVGDAPVSAIIEARKEGGPFKNIFDFCERVDTSRCGKGAVEAIVKAGGFDSLHPNRNQTLSALEDAFAAAQRAKKERESGQVALFGALMVMEDAPAAAPKLPNVPELPQGEKLAFEKDLLGLYLSDHPFLHYEAQLARFNATNSVALKTKADKEDVIVAGIVAGMRKTITKTKKEEMCMVALEDMQGKMNVTMFPRTWEACKGVVEMDRVLVVKGKANHRERIRATEEGDSVDVEVMADEVLALDGDETKGFKSYNGASKSNGNGKPLANGNGNGNGHASGNGNGNGNGKANGNGSGPRTYQRLHVDITGCDKSILSSVKSILKLHPGGNDVLVDNGGHRIHSALKVAASQEAAADVARLLGPNAVWLE